MRSPGAAVWIALAWTALILAFLTNMPHGETYRREFTIATFVLFWIIGIAGIALGNRHIRRRIGGLAASELRFREVLENASLGEDITARKAAEEALRRSEARFRELADCLPLPIFETDRGGVFTFTNRAGFDIMGFGPGDVEKSFGILDLIIPEQRPAAIARLSRLLAGEKLEPREYTIVRKDGSRLLLEAYSSPMLGDGQVAGIRGAVIDITLRKEVEDALRMYEKAIETMQLGVTISDVKGEILYVNPADARTHGYEKRELLGKNARVLAPEDRWQEISPSLRVSWVRESVNLRKDGTHFPVQLMTDVVKDQRGVPVAVVTTCEDLTERKRAEALQALGRLVSGLAHEVRGPLNAIQTSTDALELDLKEHAEHGQLLRSINTQVERLARLMRELLDLGKPLAESQLERLVLRDVCAVGIALWNDGGVNRARTARLAASEMADGEVLGDAVRLQQIMVNLLDNAVNHSPAGSEILVRIEGCEEGFRVSVADQGDGVRPEHLPKVFDPFFTTRRAGTGLGLTLVQHFVAQHKGRITLRNNDPPPGCTAEVFLPRAEAAPEPGRGVLEATR